MANHLSTFQIDARHARMVTPPPRGRCRLVTAEQAAELLPPVYERALDHPGMLERSKVWWGRRLYDSAGGRAGGWSRRRVAVYERDGAIEGYVLFRVKGDWGDFPDNKLRVGELVATDADARAGLWSYIFGIDLVTGIEAGFRPSDDPLHFMLADPRRLRTGNVDGLWVRVLDVPAALEGRRYLGSGRVRFGLEDPFLPENSGTYELEAADGVGACRRVDAEPELRLRADALGAIYTGDFSPVQLAGAGQVEELRQGAALELHRILSWPVRTYCPEVF
jgi:predicted acetyltransferase